MEVRRIVRRRGFPHFLEVVNLMRMQHFTPQKDPWYSFLLGFESTSGTQCGWIRSIEKSNNRIGNRTRDLRACNIVPQPTTLPRAPI
jgi:hypothetical protein